MNWKDILKNRRNIKIRKRKKGGEIDTSRFYSKPAIRDNSEIQKEKDLLKVKAMFNGLFESTLEDIRRLRNKLDNIDGKRYDFLVSNDDHEDAATYSKKVGEELKPLLKRAEEISKEYESLYDNDSLQTNMKKDMYARLKSSMKNYDEETRKRMTPLVRKVYLDKAQKEKLEKVKKEFRFTESQTLGNLKDELPSKSVEIR